jgi:EAL domain-containing protein (putative c-di-GMP-specific phosphodiesterase class I)
MTSTYEKPKFDIIEYDFDRGTLAGAEAYLTLSRKDVLGIVQSAFAELVEDDSELVAIKRQVLEEVARGHLARALRSAIIGAGRLKH